MVAATVSAKTTATDEDDIARGDDQTADAASDEDRLSADYCTAPPPPPPPRAPSRAIAT